MLIVERVGPLVTVQDRGRLGFARAGVPFAGPLDEALWRCTVAAVGSDVAIEIPLMDARFRVEGFRGEISVDGELVRGPVITVARGERAVRYLAVSGGIDMPVVMGSRCSWGRMLSAGDRIEVFGDRALTRAASQTTEGVADAGGPIGVVPVMGAPAATLDALLAGSFAVDARSNRVGTRLAGSVPAPRPGLSRPIVAGAVQIPPDGAPIIIGPDGPTTGGYPVVAVLPRQSRDRLARLRPGSAVRFAIA